MDKSIWALLGIPAGSSMLDARRAYRKQAVVLHPDRGGSNQAFSALTAAWRSLETAFALADAVAEGAAGRCTCQASIAAVLDGGQRVRLGDGAWAPATVSGLGQLVCAVVDERLAPVWYTLVVPEGGVVLTATGPLPIHLRRSRRATAPRVHTPPRPQTLQQRLMRAGFILRVGSAPPTATRGPWTAIVEVDGVVLSSGGRAVRLADAECTSVRIREVVGSADQA